MGSKSKRRHAQKQYNRAQNKAPVPATANTAVDAETAAVMAETTTPIMTPKDLRRAAKERAKQEKLLRKEQAKNAPEKPKEKKEKKPFFLVRFFRWLGRSIASICSELKKVHWPTFKQVMKATGIVLGIVILFGIILLGIWILFGLLHYLLVNGSLSGWTVM
ncbi:MAG: preprotein translocase subunit SecE [Prevotella sp.]|nr:preprotein translocase subunit SecE [Prevotella sp.]